MIFQHFMLNSNESNLYVVACPNTLHAAIIDAGSFDQRVPAFIHKHNLKVKAILITHGHWDHVGGADDYRSVFACPVHGMHDLTDGQTIEIGELAIKSLHTCGHTEDSVSYSIEHESVLFSGDALFAGSIGGTDSAEKKEELIGNIRQKILSLPEETIIYSGHGPATSVGVESRCNPFINGVA